MPARRLTRPSRSAAAVALAATALALAPLALAQSAPPAAGLPQPTSAPATRPAARRLTWDRVRVSAELARREAEAQRELKAAEARHAADPRDAEVVRALDAAREQLAQIRAASQKDRQEQGGEFALEKAAYLGVATSPAPPVLRKQLRLPDGVGLLVDFVEPGSPAQVAGLQPYDVAVRLDDQILVNPQQLAVLVRTFEPADDVRLTMLREGKETVLTVKLEQREVKPLEYVAFGNQPDQNNDFLREEAVAWEPEAAASVQPGDQVLISIRDFGGAGLQTIELVKVSAKGELRPPYLKKPVRAAGLSPAQIQKAIADAYRAENVVDLAKVSVKVIPVPRERKPFPIQKK